MTRIAVLATGGTISSRSRAAGGSVATDSAESLLASIATRLPEIELEGIDLLRKNSFNFTLGDLRAIVTGIAAQLARPEIDGVVVTHGTDTMEETAFLAELVHDDPRPVVFTGAQLGADDPASDGPRNLREAVLVAASPRTRGKGVLLCFGGDIFPARGLMKTHSTAMGPFAARGAGPVGHVVGETVVFRARPVRQDPFPPPTAGFDDTRVDTLLTYPGADDRLLRASLGFGARGLVIAGTGTGNPGHALVPGIAEAVSEGVLVALGTRVNGGPVVPIYGEGGAVDAVAAGAVPLGDLPLSQARILLALALDGEKTSDPAERVRRFCSPAPAPRASPTRP